MIACDVMLRIPPPLFGMFTFDPSHETCLRNHNDMHILASDQDTRQNMKYFDVE